MTDAARQQITAWGGRYADLVLELSSAGGELQLEGRRHLASGGKSDLTPIKHAAMRVRALAGQLSDAEPSGDRVFDVAMRAAAITWRAAASVWADVSEPGDESAEIVREGAHEVELASEHLGKAIERMRAVGLLPG